jgi:hypothetical protein
MTIKASSLLSIIAIWGAMIPAVIVEPGSWWSLLFAALATAAVGTGAFRRLGISRLIAISGIWAGTGLAAGSDSDAAWVAVFAFLATGATVHSLMRRDAYLGGLGILVAWLVTGLTVLVSDGHEGAWISVFAFLTAGAVANTRGNPRGIAAIIWWAGAGTIMVATEDWYWLSAIAFILTATSLGFGGFRFPRRLEWDLFERDDDDGYRVVR